MSSREACTGEGEKLVRGWIICEDLTAEKEPVAPAGTVVCNAVEAPSAGSPGSLLVSVLPLSWDRGDIVSAAGKTSFDPATGWRAEVVAPKGVAPAI
jgi:hypothetical protein